jgi:hypothetical protein
MKSFIQRIGIGLLFVFLISACGTFKVELHVLRPADIAATQAAQIMLTSISSPTLEVGSQHTTPVLNFSPADYPTPAACQIAFFWGAMPGVCPDSPAVQVEGAFQVYDGGYMLWEKATGSVYLLYNGGVGQRIEASAISDWPEVIIMTPPPANHVHPIRGFGRVWQHEENIRTSMGWPLGLEQAYTAQFQTSSSQTLNFYLYISLPNGQVIEFGKIGSWRVVR